MGNGNKPRDVVLQKAKAKKKTSALERKQQYANADAWQQWHGMSDFFGRKNKTTGMDVGANEVVGSKASAWLIRAGCCSLLLCFRSSSKFVSGAK
jgi:hypothetical protein